MSLSMYQVSVPVFIRMLTNLSAVLKKGEIHAQNKKIEPSVFTSARLAPDMFSLVRQVQIAADHAKICAAYLAGVEPPVYEDKEQSFSDLYARIDKTIVFLKSIKPAQIDGSEDRSVSVKVRGQTVALKGLNYLLEREYPNFFFHVTTAYAILRHNGVEIGKGDFLGM